MVEDDDGIRQPFEEIELRGPHVAYDQELVRLFVQARRGRPIEGMGHRRVDPLPATHQGPREDRRGGRPVGIVMAEHADPRHAIHEARGLPSPLEETLRRQVFQALHHRATYFTWSSASLSEYSHSAGMTPRSL